MKHAFNELFSVIVDATRLVDDKARLPAIERTCMTGDSDGLPNLVVAVLSIENPVEHVRDIAAPSGIIPSLGNEEGVASELAALAEFPQENRPAYGAAADDAVIPGAVADVHDAVTVPRAGDERRQGIHEGVSDVADCHQLLTAYIAGFL